jgi:hypothetical protein
LNLKEFKKSLINLEDGIKYQSKYIDDIVNGKKNIRIQAETYPLSGGTPVRSSSNKPEGKFKAEKLQDIFDNEFLTFIKMFWVKAEINLKRNNLHEAIDIYNETMDMISKQYGLNNRAFVETDTLKRKLMHKMSKGPNTKLNTIDPSFFVTQKKAKESLPSPGNIKFQKSSIKRRRSSSNKQKKTHKIERSTKNLSMYGSERNLKRKMIYPKPKMNNQRNLSRYSKQSNNMYYKHTPNYAPDSLNRIPKKPKKAKVSNRARSLNIKLKSRGNYRKSAYNKPFSNTRSIKFSSDDKFKHIRTNSGDDKDLINVRKDGYAQVMS